MCAGCGVEIGIFSPVCDSCAEKCQGLVDALWQDMGIDDILDRAFADTDNAEEAAERVAKEFGGAVDQLANRDSQ